MDCCPVHGVSSSHPACVPIPASLTVFLPRTQCSKDVPQIHHDQDDVTKKDKRMKINCNLNWLKELELVAWVSSRFHFYHVRNSCIRICISECVNVPDQTNQTTEWDWLWRFFVSLPFGALLHADICWERLWVNNTPASALKNGMSWRSIWLLILTLTDMHPSGFSVWMMVPSEGAGIIVLMVSEQTFSSAFYQQFFNPLYYRSHCDHD